MNVLSLFDGISTGRLALEMAGVKVDRYMASEIERAPMEISAANWPDIVQLGDVKHIKAADLPQNRPGDRRKPVPGIFQGWAAPEL